MTGSTSLDEAQVWVMSGSPLRQRKRKSYACGTAALSFVFLIVNLAGPVEAQETTRLQGSVADERGALVVGAQVSLDDGRGHKYRTQTNKEGRYNFVAAPGSYTLSVSATGFAEFKRSLEL